MEKRLHNGVILGKAIGAMLGRRGKVVGGFVLVGIGTRILIEHVCVA
jgi:putative Mn2+ efflux pump MntP